MLSRLRFTRCKEKQTNIGSIAWNANNLVFPIPQREMDANKKLIQNPGY
ncbi:RagB/SusD family nutrient uptake outer membrane protein [Algibacter miyuki]